MSDLLTGNKTASEVIQTSKYEGVFFIPSGGTPPNPAELLAGASARGVIGELEKDYDVLLIDSPPTLGLADARSEEHTAELQSLMRITYYVFCLKKKQEEQREQK